MTDKILLTTREAAELLNLSPAFLERDRWQGATVPFVRLGNGKGAIRYHVDDLKDYIASRRIVAPEEARNES